MKSSLNGGNAISAISTWYVATVRYVARIINLNKEELDRLDQQTRMIITIHGGLHPCENLCRVYMTRNECKRLSWKDQNC